MPIASVAYDTTSWTTFFSAEAGASAALTGLLFVAVSINLSQIISTSLLTARAAKALLTLAGVLLTATLCLVPAQPSLLLGSELALTGLILWVIIIKSQRTSSHNNPYITRSQKIFYAILAHGSTLPMVLAGVSLAIHRGAGLYWLVPG